MPKATVTKKRSVSQNRSDRSSASPKPQSDAAEKISRLAWVSLLLCLTAAAVLLWLDGISRAATVQKISAVSFSEAAPNSQRVSPGVREEWLVLPDFAMDARWWVLHTERLLHDGGWRVRHTNLDNAPEGREVHWSSSLVWVLASLATIESFFRGQPAESLVAESALIAGPVMLVVFLSLLASLVFLRWRLFAASFFVLVFLTSYPIVRTFVTGEADHHGMVVAFAMAGVICLLAAECALAGGRGAFSEKFLRRWFVAAGIFGATSLWISAATAIPILAGSAIGGLLTGLAAARRGEKSTLRAYLWLAWGLAGGLASLAFYAIEYFPDHLGWRLEVNHPLYAAAWLAGAFLLSRLLTWTATRRMPWRSPAQIALALTALAAVAAPLALIVFNPERFFWVSDKFLLSLHKKYILEFQSLFTTTGFEGGAGWLIFYTWPLAALAGVGVLATTGRLSAIGRRGALLIGPPLIITQTMTVLQVRWGSAAFGMWAIAILLLIVDLVSAPRTDRIRRWTFRGLLIWAWATILLTLLPQVAHRAEQEQTCLDAPIQQDIAGNLLLRDVAHRLIQSSPDRVPVVLSGPNASTELAYHGGVRTLGTLYWENMPGLKRAAKIFSVTDEATALQEITAAGVTHIVIPSWDNFAAAYASLLAAAEGRTQSETPFFKAIVEGDECPRWLRPFAYPIPTNSGLDTNSVKIFAVLPQQSEFEYFYFRGIYYFEIAQMDKARPMFAEAAKLRPSDERPPRFLQEIDRRSSGGASRK